ncbi:MAG: hypothetical protein WAQ33_07990 [Gaiellaceae bacterium]
MLAPQRLAVLNGNEWSARYERCPLRRRDGAGVDRRAPEKAESPMGPVLPASSQQHRPLGLTATTPIDLTGRQSGGIVGVHDTGGEGGFIVRKLFALTGLTAGLAVALALPASGAGRWVTNAHFTIHDTFADNTCGIDGTTVMNGVENFRQSADGSFTDIASFKAVFTATASGKSIELQVAQQLTGSDTPVDNGDGTVTFSFTFKGLPEKLKIPNGPILSRDAGIVTFHQTFDATTGAFISQTLSGEKGPHPDLDSGFAIFCNVLVPALT